MPSKNNKEQDRKTRSTILLVLMVALLSTNSFCQAPSAKASLEATYGGTWVNKKDSRYLMFFFEKDAPYVTVNEWTGNSDRSESETIDSYKAWIKNNKLVLPPENSDHHAPYCELIVQGKQLICRCNATNNFKDTVLVEPRMDDATVFERLGD